MTKKHFEMFAEMLREIPSRAKRLDFAMRIVEVCKRANPRFDENKFREAADARLLLVRPKVA